MNANGRSAARRPWREKFRRWGRYRFVVPLKRSRHSPGYIARSVSAGLFWAMTPSIGVQMALVMVHWGLVKKFWPQWDFSVIQAMAWTWVTNFLTMIPVYYLFYVTGQLFLGRFDDLTGYQGFVDLWNASFGDEGEMPIVVEGVTRSVTEGVTGWWDKLWQHSKVIFVGWGLPMLVGCGPYAVVSAWLGHRWALKLVTGHRRNVTRRRLARGPDHSHDGGGDQD
ncbi:MAG: DUF2062 domain-containing protein [Pseudomonadota bacterium]|nr:DUF2062 domain-containing protein [Pseudomonadota bacterium]